MPLHTRTIDEARRLPALRLPDASGEIHPILPGRRRAPVLLLLHPNGCPACAEYLVRMEGLVGEAEAWDGHLLAIVPGSHATPSDPDSGKIPVLVDREGRLQDALGTVAPAVIIADQWGEIHLRESAGDDHHFEDPREILEWLRYLAIQCPECQGEAE